MTRFYQPDFFLGWLSNCCCYHKVKHQKNISRTRVSQREIKREQVQKWQNEKKREKKAFQKFIYIRISWSVYPILFRVQVFTATQNSCCDTCSRRRAKLFRSYSISISLSLSLSFAKLFGKSCWRKMHECIEWKSTWNCTIWNANKWKGIL